MKCRGFFASVAALSVQGDDRMRRALTVLLTFCTVASTAVDCPATNITQRDVDRSLFVALVEVNSIEAKGNQDNDYFMFNVWYEKLFKVRDFSFDIRQQFRRPMCVVKTVSSNYNPFSGITTGSLNTRS
ncbi:hypothetical protein Y032_0009g683 [Ancylostoma ceylanicum]|uniref:Uncharacterized protein n=1 Tax=Ancylostoma ceylanicum TaxID=53326 RepID=A0A016VIC9_9BILA|nr:hypothetical protein Y032_0009g683 [Ancylostoma ceylanicum]